MVGSEGSNGWIVGGTRDDALSRETLGELDGDADLTECSGELGSCVTGGDGKPLSLATSPLTLVASPDVLDGPVLQDERPRLDVGAAFDESSLRLSGPFGGGLFEIGIPNIELWS